MKILAAGPTPGPAKPKGAQGVAHLPVATLLPVSAREALIQAATNPNLSPKERKIAIAKATQKARNGNPKLYKEIES